MLQLSKGRCAELFAEDEAERHGPTTRTREREISESERVRAARRKWKSIRAQRQREMIAKIARVKQLPDIVAQVVAENQNDPVVLELVRAWAERLQSILPVERRFARLADRWERETRNMSSPNAAERHPAYQQIIDLGKPVIPLILKRLAEYPSFWFKALLIISAEPNDPVQPSMHGDVQAMADAWLSWGERNGYLPKAQH